MSQPFIPIPVDWVKHPLYRKLLRRDSSYPDRFMSLIHLTAASREPGKLIVSDGTPLGIDEFAEHHDRDFEAWSAFMDFGAEIGILEKDGETWIVSIWKLFSRDPVAESKERQRKRADYYAGKTEKAKEELDQLKAEFARLRSEMEEEQEAPPASSDGQEVPETSDSLHVSPEVSGSLQKSPPIDIDLDIDLKRDLEKKIHKRSNTSACAENSALEKKPPARSPGAPASWSASLFKNELPPEKILEHTKRYYAKLAEICDLKPSKLTSELQVELLRTLSRGRWSKYEDPLVHLVAIAMGANLAAHVGTEGYCTKDSVWPFALKEAERCLEGAQKVCNLNRDAVELGEPIISAKEADNYLPTTLEKELAAIDSS